MSNAVKTIVILTPAFPSDESDTQWATFQQLFVKALKKNFPDINIIVLSFLYPYHKSDYSWHGIKVISFGGMRKRKIKKLFLFSDIWRTLKTIRRENNLIGLISCWCGECALIGKWFGKWNRVRHFCWICGQDARETNRLVKFIRPKPDELVAMSPFLVKEFEKNHGIKPKHLIANGIVPELFPSTTKERNIDILGAGSLQPLKQYDLFTEVIRLVQLRIPDIRAFHCGIGLEKEKIESMIKEFRLENNFQLLGGKPHHELLELMQQTKVFLHTSLYEGFGAVCFEALYAGAHVISFNYPLDYPVKNWHVVETKEEMAAKTIDILLNQHTEYNSVLLYSMDDSAKGFMRLFDH